jgi:serine/threonine-protein kinase
MENRGPLFTLLAVVVLGGVLFGINVSKEQTEPAARPAVAATTPTTTTPPAPTTTTPPASMESAYVGRTATGDASVAIAVKDGKAVAYLCDGSRTELWLQGTVTGETLELQGKDGRLSGTMGNGQVVGVITPGTGKWEFTAAAAQEPAGLYRATNGIGEVLDRIGWIVQSDGSTVGIRSTDGTGKPAPPLDPKARTVAVDGKQLPVEHVVGDSGLR